MLQWSNIGIIDNATRDASTRGNEGMQTFVFINARGSEEWMKDKFCLAEHPRKLAGEINIDIGRLKNQRIHAAKALSAFEN